MVTTEHWRLLEDGRVVIASFSENRDAEVPLEDGVVRAELLMGGYVLQPLSPSETMVHYVVQV